jgi:hypothetical protein
MQTRIKNIENPPGLLMRVAYWVSKRRYGKVLSPLKAVYSRLPLAFSLWVNRIHPLEQKLEIGQELALLVRVYVSQLNTCEFCIDMGKAISIGKFGNEEKFLQLADYPRSDRYTPAEKAALDFAHALTVHKKIPDEVYWRANRFFFGKPVDCPGLGGEHRTRLQPDERGLQRRVRRLVRNARASNAAGSSRSRPYLPGGRS